MANPPDRLVFGVDDDVADPRIVQQHLAFARVDIDRKNVAIGVIILGIEGRPAVGIVSQRRDAVEHRSFDVRQL